MKLEVDYKIGEVKTPSKEYELNNKIMQDMADTERYYEDKQNKENEKVLNRVKELKGEKFYDVLDEYIEEQGCFHAFSIVDYKRGNKQDVEDVSSAHLAYEWVDQSCGYCEDDYYGSIYLHIKGNRYLKCDFTM